MSLAILHSRASLGMDAPEVRVEVHLANGLPSCTIVGLPEKAVKESRDRVRSALLQCRFEFPAQRITVNLAPAELPKEGGRFDLAIALGILIASHQLPPDKHENYEFAGELGLSGQLCTTPNLLGFAVATQKKGKRLCLPLANTQEVGLVKGLTFHAAEHLLEVCAHLKGNEPLPAQQSLGLSIELTTRGPDWSDVRGQADSKRALSLAAAGGHSALLIGPPGSGKTMLASRLPSILPPLSDDKALEVAMISNMSHVGFVNHTWGKRPFRAPHHTASSAALVGGGNPPKPGEISLAHHGILFLDELPEFTRHSLETLREPLESGHIVIARASQHVTFPAEFQLIAAMNPCPCGYYQSSNGKCHCTREAMLRYRQKISGPLLDRIDISCWVPTQPPSEWLRPPKPSENGINSADLRLRIADLHEHQKKRQGVLNARLDAKVLNDYCVLSAGAEKLLHRAAERWELSARGCHRAMRLARTIADWESCSHIEENHMAEALHYKIPGE